MRLASLAFAAALFLPFLQPAKAPYTQPDIPSATVVMYDGDASQEYSGTVVCYQLQATLDDVTTSHYWYGIYDDTSGTIYLSGSNLADFDCDTIKARISFLVPSGFTQSWSSYDLDGITCDPECTLTFGKGGAFQVQMISYTNCHPPQQTSGTGTPPGYGDVDPPPLPSGLPVNPLDPPNDELPPPPTGPVGPA